MYIEYYPLRSLIFSTIPIFHNNFMTNPSLRFHSQAWHSKIFQKNACPYLIRVDKDPDNKTGIPFCSRIDNYSFISMLWIHRKVSNENSPSSIVTLLAPSGSSEDLVEVPINKQMSNISELYSQLVSWNEAHQSVAEHMEYHKSGRYSHLHADVLIQQSVDLLFQLQEFQWLHSPKKRIWIKQI